MDIDQLVLLGTGSAMVLIAVLVGAVGIGRGLHRALGLILAARGAVLLLPHLSSDPRWGATAVNLQPYFAMAIAPVALYVLATMGQDAGRRRRWAFACFGVLAVAEVAYALDHALVHSLAPGLAATGALQATSELRFTAFGPLQVVIGLAGPLLALLGLRFAVAYRAAPEAPSALTNLLVAAGLLAGGLFDGANRLVAVTNLLDSGAAFPWLAWGWAVMVLPMLGLLPALLGTAVLAAGRFAEPRPLHRLEGSMIVLLGLAFVTGFVRLVAPPDSDVGGSALVIVLLGAWRLAMPLTVAYALLHDALAHPHAGMATAPAAAAET